MKYRITLLSPDEVTRDRMGSLKQTYTETVTVWAERVKLTGTRRTEVGERFSTYDAEFNIRDEHEVDDHWRVQQLGGHLYEVNNIVPNIDKGYKTLQCTRINE